MQQEATPVLFGLVARSGSRGEVSPERGEYFSSPRAVTILPLSTRNQAVRKEARRVHA